MDMEFPSTKSRSLIVEAWSTQCRNFQPALFPGGFLPLQNRCLYGSYLLFWLHFQYIVAIMRILLNYWQCMFLNFLCTCLFNIIVLHDVMCFSFCVVPVVYVRSCLGRWLTFEVLDLFQYRG